MFLTKYIPIIFEMLIKTTKQINQKDFTLKPVAEDEDKKSYFVIFSKDTLNEVLDIVNTHIEQADVKARKDKAEAERKAQKEKEKAEISAKEAARIAQEQAERIKAAEKRREEEEKERQEIIKKLVDDIKQNRDPNLMNTGLVTFFTKDITLENAKKKLPVMESYWDNIKELLPMMQGISEIKPIINQTDKQKTTDIENKIIETFNSNKSWLYRFQGNSLPDIEDWVWGNKNILFNVLGQEMLEKYNYNKSSAQHNIK